jgi:hypothetical protein
MLKDPSIRTFYLRASRAEQERFDERAAILEFDGGMQRPQAEYQAFLEILKLRRANQNNSRSYVVEG